MAIFIDVPYSAPAWLDKTFDPAQFADIRRVRTTTRQGYRVVRGRSIVGRSYVEPERFFHTVHICGHGWEFTMTFSDTSLKVYRKRLLRTPGVRQMIWRALRDSEDASAILPAAA